MKSRITMAMVTLLLLVTASSASRAESAVACWRKPMYGERVCLCTDGHHPWQRVGDFVCQFLMDS